MMMTCNWSAGSGATTSRIGAPPFSALATLPVALRPSSGGGTTRITSFTPVLGARRHVHMSNVNALALWKNVIIVNFIQSLPEDQLIRHLQCTACRGFGCSHWNDLEQPGVSDEGNMSDVMEEDRGNGHCGNMCSSVVYRIINAMPHESTSSHLGITLAPNPDQLPDGLTW